MSKPFIIILFSFALMLFSSPSEGSDWKLVETLTEQGQNPKFYDTYFYINMNSIQKIGDKVRYWENIQSVPHGDPEPTDNQVIKKGHMTYYEVDCSRKRYRNVTTEKEEGNGYVQVYPGIVWDNIKPDSIEEKIEKIVCKRRK
jgi:hypothetical protein